MNIFIYNKNTSFNTNSYKKQRGFTLIELLVVIGIMVVLTSITLANYPRFGMQVYLRNLTYSIALSVRQAQVYGISSLGLNGAFSNGHGIYFDMQDASKFTLYTDVVGDNFFTVSPSSDRIKETVKVFSLNGGFKIVKLCVTKNLVENCSVNALDIIFKRPEPDAVIRARIGGGGFKLYDSAKVVIISPIGDERGIFIESAGQISVVR